MRTPPAYIVLVDDDADTREMYAWSLEARGFEVAGAGTVAQAIERADARRPDLIVTDFTLPGEDGFMLASRIRASRTLADTPMVLVSGRAFVAGSGERALELFDRVLLKPVMPDDLIGEIVPLLVDRTAARLQRQVRAVREQVRRVPHGSGVDRILEAVSEVAGPAAPPAALLADGSAHYIAANEAACDLTGRSRDELLGMSVWDLTPQVEVADGRRQWAQFVEYGALSGDYRLRTAGGIEVPAKYAAAAHVLPGCHLSLLLPVPSPLVAEL